MSRLGTSGNRHARCRQLRRRLGAAAPASVQVIDRRELLASELEVENVDVLRDARGPASTWGSPTVPAAGASAA